MRRLDDLASELARLVREYVSERAALLESKIAARMELMEVRQGPAGLPGQKGDPGEPGERGEQGERGEKGEPGERGERGEKGEKGEKGDAGVDGLHGEKGEPGEPGARGEPGKDGRDGIDGKDGKDGADGLTGKDGKDGLDGKDGERGTPGIDGKDGLVGAKGEDGRDGKDGRDGNNGRDGKDGINGRDAAELPILSTIDLERSYAPGQWARFRGGLWKSEAQTKGIEGWTCMVNGLYETSAEMVGKCLTVTIKHSDGTESAMSRVLPVMIDRGVWSEGESYDKGDSVSYAGSSWIAQVDMPTERPGTGQQWRLAVKRGRDGKDGKK